MTVGRVTGHDDCDQACEAGWVKFTVGLPYHTEECLFEKQADRRKLTGAQKAWLNEWLASITDTEGGRPVF